MPGISKRRCSPPRMNEAVLYSKYSGLQRRDAAHVLDEYLDKVRWRDGGGDAVLDVGCGAGDVLRDLLLPRMPTNFQKVLGLDLSEEMVEFARKRNSHPLVTFRQMDIAAPDVDPDFEEAFDHLFSFYCLHWIQNQRRALANMLTMLAPGGDMLLTFLASNPIFDIYESLSKNGRWELYMENFKNYVSPYQNSKNPEEEFEDLLKEVGFQIDLCKVEERLYTYPNVAVLKKSITAVSPFYRKIPENMKDDYLTDYISEVKKLNLLEARENNNNEVEGKVQVPYKLFIVYARKKC